jgi:hypothetical protein
MGVIIICGLVLIPLMGRIQNRIIKLMSLFFAIDQDLKEKMVKRIVKFKTYFKKPSENLADDNNNDNMVE